MLQHYSAMLVRVTQTAFWSCFFIALLLCVSSPAPAQFHSSFTQEGAKLVGTNAGQYANQGYSVALSADGNTAIVGGYNDEFGTGAVWIFTRSGTGLWSQQGGKLVGTGAVGKARQGFSVALSDDGNTALVGGSEDNPFGAAWVFSRSGEVWSQQGGKLVGIGTSGSIAPRQGWSVALSGDGNTALIGGPMDAGGAGAVWVFARSNGVWTQQGAKLSGGGNSAALSRDGNTAIFAKHPDLGGGALVFTRNNVGQWSQEGTVGAGSTVALSDDGNTALVGTPGDNNSTGAAWVFTRSGGVWTQGAKLVGSGPVGPGAQGSSVALSGDGNIALIGGPSENGNTGAAWVFTRSSGSWSQQGGKLVGTGGVGSSSQGQSVALSGDGSTAFIGGPDDNNPVGAAWAFASAQLLLLSSRRSTTSTATARATSSGDRPAARWQRG